ncbi:hypothetical protein EYF80_027140 [Liparis tanakae]|uniref:Uncharacterized protein n=1 Tax=Liparis tanakae TaxID=230148 RepID=A0A4Z2HCW4_9TELE|nr:hypothetical protein EYF80_027140 [Liparis tanakae]
MGSRTPSAVQSHGFRHWRWKAAGQWSQHSRSPPSRQLSQVSWLVALPLLRTSLTNFRLLFSTSSDFGGANTWGAGYLPSVALTPAMALQIIRYSFVERAGQTLRASGKRFVRRGFCACTKMCAELDAYMYTPEGRQTHAEHAGPTPDTRRARWTNARHTQSTLGIRCMFVG